jgi:hypothetical protein
MSARAIDANGTVSAAAKRIAAKGIVANGIAEGLEEQTTVAERI